MNHCIQITVHVSSFSLVLLHLVLTFVRFKLCTHLCETYNQYFNEDTLFKNKCHLCIIMRYIALFWYFLAAEIVRGNRSVFVEYSLFSILHFILIMCIRFFSVPIVPWVCEYSYDALLWPRNYVYTIHILYLYWTLTYCKLRVINMQYTHYYKWSLYPWNISNLHHYEARRTQLIYPWVLIRIVLL